MKHIYMFGTGSNVLKCMTCQKTFPLTITNATRTNPSFGTFELNFDYSLGNGITNLQEIGLFGNLGDTVSVTDNITSNHYKETIKFVKHYEGVGASHKLWIFYYNGEGYKWNISATNLIVDNIPPVISQAIPNDNINWSRTKSIIISGTENYCTSVTAKILNNKGKTIFTR